MNGIKRFYICDRTRCGDRCSAARGECTHTSDIEHARFRSPDYQRRWTYKEENEPILYEITHEQYNEVMEHAGMENRPAEQDGLV